MNKDHLMPLWIAGGAVLFVSSLLPLCGSIVDLVQSVINVKINRMSMELELDKAEHEAAAEKIAPSPAITQAIGFSLPSEPEYEEEYEWAVDLNIATKSHVCVVTISQIVINM